MSRQSLRPIREAAVQFLYCLCIEGEDHPSPDAQHPFWSVLLEKDENKLAQARAKAVLFIAQGRATRLEKLEKHSLAAIDQLRPVDESEELRNALQRTLNFEHELSRHLLALEHAQQQIKHSDSVSLIEPMQDVFSLSEQLERTRRESEQLAADFPAFRAALTPVFAANGKLQRISDRLRAIESPRLFPDEAATQHLASDESRLTEIREKATEMVRGTLDHLTDLDAAIAAMVQNFNPERLTPVDRAILRWGAWDMLYAKTPGPLVINEAVAIARRLSTADSASFVNGVLDGVFKSAFPESSNDSE